jgi:hypothetical protein
MVCIITPLGHPIWAILAGFCPKTIVWVLRRIGWLEDVSMHAESSRSANPTVFQPIPALSAAAISHLLNPKPPLLPAAP